MGRAPAPFYDPLAFAVAEAHARGLELHAWFNPYRAHFPADKSPIAANHISSHGARTSCVKYGPYLWMDPGKRRSARLHGRVSCSTSLGVTTSTAIHIDDYFYPYREQTPRGREIPFPDDRPGAPIAERAERSTATTGGGGTWTCSSSSCTRR